MRGASLAVQVALGWSGQGLEVRSPFTTSSGVTCECGGQLRFDVADPLLIGRSMQACDNPRCEHHLPHLMTRDPEFSPLPSPPPRKKQRVSLHRA